MHESMAAYIRLTFGAQSTGNTGVADFSESIKLIKAFFKTSLRSTSTR